MEWTVVTVIIALIGLVTAIITPLIKLNTTITKLTVIVDGIEKRYSGISTLNSEAHCDINRRIEEHGIKISEHDTDIAVLKEKVG
jgi:uncharacterized protein (DUF2141 family)